MNFWAVKEQLLSNKISCIAGLLCLWTHDCVCSDGFCIDVLMFCSAGQKQLKNMSLIIIPDRMRRAWADLNAAGRRAGQKTGTSFQFNCNMGFKDSSLRTSQSWMCSSGFSLSMNVCMFAPECFYETVLIWVCEALQYIQTRFKLKMQNSALWSINNEAN